MVYLLPQIILLSLYMYIYHISTSFLECQVSNEALANKFCKQYDLRSHWIRSRLNCCSAPIVTCLILLSIRKFISDVATCLQADMQEVLATFSCCKKRTILSNSIYMCKLITNHWDQYTLCGSLLKGKKKKKNPHTYEYFHSSWAFWYGFKDKLVSKNISPIKIIIPNAKTTK